ncbi:MAG: ATP-binding protein [bacterium]|jgi:DNA polymerase-3 subunit delta'
MLFKEIPGHEEIKERLLRSKHENRISHAQLFLGPSGSGNLALAIAYAQLINCTNATADDSCGECSSCRKYEKYIHPDLHFSYPFITKKAEETSTVYIKEWRKALLDSPFLGLQDWLNYLEADNKRPNINIAECHDIIKRLAYKSFEAEYKVLVMWLPEFLGNAGNTLLKLIEEPPEKTLFILVSEQYDQILNTILSRTQLVKINALDDKTVKDYLIQKGCEEDLAARYAYLANGNLQAALNFTVEEDGDFEGLFVQWLRLCYARKGIELQTLIDEIAVAAFGRTNQINFLRFGLQVLRECVVHNADVKEIIRFESKHFELPKLASIINEKNAGLIIQHLEQAIYHIERNANAKILFLDLSIQVMRDLQRKM